VADGEDRLFAMKETFVPLALAWPRAKPSDETGQTAAPDQEAA